MMDDYQPPPQPVWRHLLRAMGLYLATFAALVALAYLSRWLRI